MEKSFSKLKKGDFVKSKFGDKYFVGVFKLFIGSDKNLQTKSGETINPSHYASIAFGRQAKCIHRDKLIVLSEIEINERIEECKVAYAYFHKFHLKD